MKPERFYLILAEDRQVFQIKVMILCIESSVYSINSRTLASITVLTAYSMANYNLPLGFQIPSG